MCAVRWCGWRMWVYVDGGWMDVWMRVRAVWMCVLGISVSCCGVFWVDVRVFLV